MTRGEAPGNEPNEHPRWGITAPSPPPGPPGGLGQRGPAAISPCLPSPPWVGGPALGWSRGGEAAILPRVPWGIWGEGLLLGPLPVWPSSHLALLEKGRERVALFPSYRTEGFLLPLGF